jgi:hypothetical protein
VKADQLIGGQSMQRRKPEREKDKEKSPNANNHGV